MQSPSRTTASLVLIGLLLAETWPPLQAEEINAVLPSAAFQREALSPVALSTIRLDHWLSVLDRTFERLFGDFSDSSHGAWASAGLPNVSFISFSVPLNPQGSASSAHGDRRRIQVESEYKALSELEQQAGRLAIKTIALHEALKKADKMSDLSPFLAQTVDLHVQVAQVTGSSMAPDLFPRSGRSREFGRLIDRQSKRFRDAAHRHDERALSALNLETRALVIARVHCQLASAEEQLRLRYRPIALASLFGAAKSLWRLRREANWQRGRLYRRTAFVDDLALEGTEEIAGYLEPGLWLKASYQRPEHRQTLFNQAQRVWGKRRGLTTYDSILTFLRSQDQVMNNCLTAALELSDYMAYLRSVQLLIEFKPELQDLRKAQRDARLVGRWAARGTGTIRQAVAKALSRMDAALSTAIRLRGQSSGQERFEDVHTHLRSSIEIAREILAKRLEEIKSIRQETFNKVRAFVTPHLQPDLSPRPEDSLTLEHSA